MEKTEDEMFQEEVLEKFKPLLKVAQVLAPELARTHRTMFEELKKVGFTEEQAIQICSRQSVGK